MVSRTSQNGSDAGLPDRQQLLLLPNPAHHSGWVAKSQNTFDDPGFADAYADRAPRTVPAYHDIHRMAAVLIAEHVPADARILVLGAGGGLEMKAFAQAHPEWTFDAVDPAAAMLHLAVTTMGSSASRVRMHQGYIDDAPSGPFDAATSLLTLHFLDPGERRRTVAEVRRRLKPGAPFIAAHLSFPQRDDAERELWMRRHSDLLVASGIDPTDAERSRTTVANEVPALTPEHDRAILQDVGFTDVTEFFSAFTFRGWVGYA
jgi:tRNA (cmo5U34)-methyltransferase